MERSWIAVVKAKCGCNCGRENEIKVWEEWVRFASIPALCQRARRQLTFVYTQNIIMLEVSELATGAELFSELKRRNCDQ